MSLKKAVIICVMLIAIVGAFFWFLERKTDPQMRLDENQSNLTPNPTRLSQSNNLTVAESVDRSQKNVIELLGGDARTLPADALSFMQKAVSCAILIEQRKRAFEPRSPGYVMLDGLQRKLFIDDYCYAALVTTKLDRSGVNGIYSNLLQRLAQLDLPQLESYNTP